jgi:hypothetical protein
VALLHGEGQSLVFPQTEGAAHATLHCLLMHACDLTLQTDARGSYTPDFQRYHNCLARPLLGGRDDVVSPLITLL